MLERTGFFAPREMLLRGLRRTRPLVALHAAPALRRACSGSASPAGLAGDRPSASQAPVTAEVAADLGSLGHGYSRAVEDKTELGDAALVEINDLLQKRLDASASRRFAEAEAYDSELRDRFEVTVMHRGRVWRADHGGAKLPPFKVLGGMNVEDGSAPGAEAAAALGKVRQWAAAVDAKQPEAARAIRAELARQAQCRYITVTSRHTCRARAAGAKTPTTTGATALP